MSASRTRLIIVMLCLLWCMSGCQHSRHQAAKAVADEVKSRQQKHERSKDLYDEGLVAYRASNFERAHKKLRRAVAEDDRHGSAWLALGVVEYQQSRHFAAAEAFDRAARLLPTRFEPRFNLGTVFESVGRYAKAIDHYQAALKLTPDNVEVMENLARCYIKTNQNLEDAKELLDRALASEHRPKWRRWIQENSLKLSRHGRESHLSDWKPLADGTERAKDNSTNSQPSTESK